MANLYALQQVGVADGTVIPAAKADGRQVSAKESVTVASKVAGQAWANGDKIFLGRLRAANLCRDGHQLWYNHNQHWHVGDPGQIRKRSIADSG